MKNTLLLFSLILIQLSVFSQTIDKSKSMVYFKIGNMGISNVKGTFSGFTGKVNFNPNQLESAKIDVCIDASSINTKNKKRDEHLRSEDFFEVVTYPTICFTSDKITKSGGKYIAQGKLTLHGVTKTIEIPLTFQDNKLTSFFTLDRFDYKIGEDTGTFMVGTEVEIAINCFLIP
nr:YceI family protein [uncultured Brumimicrobium sp.]